MKLLREFMNFQVIVRHFIFQLFYSLIIDQPFYFQLTREYFLIYFSINLSFKVISCFAIKLIFLSFCYSLEELEVFINLVYLSQIK